MSDNGATKDPSDFQLQSYRIDLTTRDVRHEVVTCEDYEDVFGGIARGFKLLAECPLKDPYDPAATLLMNLGILSGTDFMTGLRTYFHAYSPLKTSYRGRPSAMWSAGSGKFGTHIRNLGIDEILFTGRCEKPTVLLITRDSQDAPPQFQFEDGSHLCGRRLNDKIQTLHQQYPQAHFAAIGPAGENFQQVRYAAIGLSTENQLRSGDPKPRFCGRGGIGGVMGSKNLLAIVADEFKTSPKKSPAILKEINQEVAKGKGSARFRDKKKFNGGGGTWANYEALNPVHAMPEMNFNPTGTVASVSLHRDHVEAQGPFLVKDESCYRCGISCHKNLYDKTENGKPGKFRAKLDFEPLNLLASNIGIFDVDQAATLVELVDEMGMDSISCGTTLAFAMEYNHRNPDKKIADGISYGDFQTTKSVIEKIGVGQMEELGQGTLRLGTKLGTLNYAMQSKGMEFPAYLPQTNPGYPWALAGGHMSMRTYLLLLYERETDIEYWVDAITNTTRGLSILRDDFLGVCKFSGLSDERMVAAIGALTGLKLDVADLQRTIRRSFLRGYKLEKVQGFQERDYVLPTEAHKEYPQIELPYLNSPDFFAELKPKVLARFDEMLVEEGLA